LKSASETLSRSLSLHTHTQHTSAHATTTLTPVSVPGVERDAYDEAITVVGRR
jgi:hypothetical protein